MRRARKLIAWMIPGSCLLLAGCTGSSPLGSLTVPLDKVSTSGVIAAVYLSPQNAGLNEGQKAYVALIDREGSFKTIETNGMDVGQMVWAPTGLAFADTSGDYLLSDGLQQRKLQRSNHQVAMYYDESSDSFVSLFNKGFTGTGGYEEELVVSGVTGSSSSLVEGAYSMTSQCGAKIFGIAPRSGRYLPAEVKERFDAGLVTPGQMLTQLYPLAAGSESLVGSGESPDTGEPRGNAPCVSNSISYPTYTFAPGDDRSLDTAVIRTWSIGDGSMRDVPLTGDVDGLDSDVLGQSTIIGADADGRVRWALPSGAILVTDPATGDTDEEYRLVLENDAPYMLYTVSGNSLWAFEEPSREGEEVVLHRCRIEDGRECTNFEVSGLAEHIGVDMVPRSVAAPATS